MSDDATRVTEPDRSTLEGMATRLLDRTLAEAGAPLAAAFRAALVELMVESVELGMHIERGRPPEDPALVPALRAALVREDSLDMWCAHSSSEGEAYALAGSREECRDELIRLREQGDEGGFAEAVASVDHALDHGDVFVARCAVRVAWVNDGDERAPTPAWLDTVPE